MTFKSQRGRTYHIRTVHFQSLNRQINVQRDQYEGNNNHWEDQEYGDHYHQSTDSPDDTHSTYSMGSSSILSVNDLGPVGQRNEHPHLTGMWALYAMSA